jgi:hypothetical protein
VRPWASEVKEVELGGGGSFFRTARDVRTAFDPDEVAELFEQASEERVRGLQARLKDYIGENLPRAIARKKTLQDYRTNPYVLMATSSVMDLEDPHDFAQFLVNNKLYMGLETSFGKSVESIVMGAYPAGVPEGVGRRWEDPAEKIAEFAGLKGLSREERARRRGASVWREIDRSVVYGDRRYLLTIKSGPSTVNDTQVNAMKDAIRDHHREWLSASRGNNGVEGIDVVLGLTYGTPRTTNNKDNQLVVKLLEEGFRWEDEATKPGVLVDEETGRVRVYRLVGIDFWAFVARPDDPASSPFGFLEVLLALSGALREVTASREVEDRLNDRLQMLAEAIATLRFPSQSLPGWVREEFSDKELFWLASALTAFYDEGI